MHVDMQTQVYIPHMSTHADMHAGTRTRMSVHTSMYTNMHICPLATETHMCARTHTCAQRCPHEHICTRTVPQ